MWRHEPQVRGMLHLLLLHTAWRLAATHNLQPIVNVYPQAP